MIGHKYLSNLGYSLSKKKLSKDQLKDIKQKLTVKPDICQDYSVDVESFPVYTEDSKYIYVPRYFGIKEYGEPDKSLFKSNKADINFKGSLRDYQLEIVDSTIKSMNKLGGGIISLYCGAGKTTLSLYIACQLKLKTLVVVHKTFLQNQWYERIQQFTDAKIGVIRQNKVDVKNKDIVIGMLQSISMREYDSEIFQNYDLVIFDECHHTGSKVYCKALQKITAKYTIGLSATPNRSDGMTKVINWYLGDVIYKLTREGDKQVIVKMFEYESNNKLFSEKKMFIKNKIKPAIQKMITNLYKINERNKFITDIINSLRKKYERKILVLSNRLNCISALKLAIDNIINNEVSLNILEDGEVTTSMYVGGMKEYELAEASKADIIFSTYPMAAEGLDIDRLNTLVLADPKKDIIQSIGRIMRKPIKEGDIVPLIVDISDKFSIFPNWTSIRKKFYTKNKYTICSYHSFNDKCINIRDYLILKNIILKKHDKDLDINKKYLCYKHGDDYLDFLEDFKDSEDDVDKNKDNSLNYDENLDKIFEIATATN